MSCPSSSCPFNTQDGCPFHSDPSECDLAELLPAEKDPYFTPAPLYVRFTYRDEWRHVPEDETFSMFSEFDLSMAARGFQNKHQSNGALIVFCTSDLIEWEILGTITERGALIHEDVV
jgi:hypothetical protein